MLLLTFLSGVTRIAFRDYRTCMHMSAKKRISFRWNPEAAFFAAPLPHPKPGATRVISRCVRRSGAAVTGEPSGPWPLARLQAQRMPPLCFSGIALRRDCR